MESPFSKPKSPGELALNPSWKSFFINPSTWIVITAMVTITVFHYFRVNLLPPAVNAFLNRHAVDRILFMFPIVFSTYSLGRRSGLFFLAMTGLIMFPRAFWISSYPVDALIETAAVILVGYYVIRIVSSQAEEKVLRQYSELHQLQVLQRLNKVAEQITSELELDRILIKVLEIAEELTMADGGGIALIDPDGGSIKYQYLHNLPQSLSKVTFLSGVGVAGEVISTCRPVIVKDYQSYPTALPEFLEAGLTDVVSVPIIKGEHIIGAMTLVNTHGGKQFSNGDLDILSGIGRLAGIAIDNGRLYEQMRFYARMITDAQESERKRIARELHDDTVQMLIALSRQIESLLTNLDSIPEIKLGDITALQVLTGTAIQDLRRFIQDLRPSLLDHLGLIAALEDLAHGLAEDNITADFQIFGELQRLTPEEELILFRIAQEALNNLRRHSGASEALIQIRFKPDMLRLTIEDNGIGFDMPRRLDDLVSTGKLGLLGMQERARMLGGNLKVQAAIDEGTTIIVDVPRSF